MRYDHVSESFSLIILGLHYAKSRIALLNPETELKLHTEMHT